MREFEMEPREEFEMDRRDEFERDRNVRGLPTNIRQLLEVLKGQFVTLILESGERECHVKIEDITGNLLLVRLPGQCGSRFKFVDIECICAVITNCEEVLRTIFRDRFLRRNPEC